MIILVIQLISQLITQYIQIYININLFLFFFPIFYTESDSTTNSMKRKLLEAEEGDILVIKFSITHTSDM